MPLSSSPPQRDTKLRLQPTLTQSPAKPSMLSLVDQRLVHTEETDTPVDAEDLTSEVEVDSPTVAEAVEEHREDEAPQLRTHDFPTQTQTLTSASPHDNPLRHRRCTILGVRLFFTIPRICTLHLPLHRTHSRLALLLFLGSAKTKVQQNGSTHVLRLMSLLSRALHICIFKNWVGLWMRCVRFCEWTFTLCW